MTTQFLTQANFILMWVNKNLIRPILGFYEHLWSLIMTAICSPKFWKDLTLFVTLLIVIYAIIFIIAHTPHQETSSSEPEEEKISGQQIILNSLSRFTFNGQTKGFLISYWETNQKTGGILISSLDKSITVYFTFEEMSSLINELIHLNPANQMETQRARLPKRNISDDKLVDMMGSYNVWISIDQQQNKTLNIVDNG